MLNQNLSSVIHADNQISIAARKRAIVAKLTKIVEHCSFPKPVVALDVEGIWSVDRDFCKHSWGVQIEDKSNLAEIIVAVEMLGMGLSLGDWIDSEVDWGDCPVSNA